MTELPWPSAGNRLADLPSDAAGAADVTRGLLVHRDWAPGLGLQFDATRLADQHLRPMTAVVERVLEISPMNLVSPRDLPDRMVGVCRHFTTLHVALLRNAGVPARARVGFARYFGDGWVDHWITEWWDGDRWVRTDAQVGPLARQLLDLSFDPADQPPGEFLTAGEAWQRVRTGEEDANHFGIFDLRGMWFVAGSLTLDLGALNKVELLPWDIWGDIGFGPGAEPSPEQLARADALAALLLDDDLDELRARFAQPDVAVPATITAIIDGVPTQVDIAPDLLAV
jgi:hypothetical protein